jgi:hypothetical protein
MHPMNPVMSLPSWEGPPPPNPNPARALPTLPPCTARRRRVDAQTGAVTTIAGSGEEGPSTKTGLATAVPISNPQGIYVDIFGNVFFSDGPLIRCAAAAPHPASVPRAAGRRPSHQTRAPACSPTALPARSQSTGDPADPRPSPPRRRVDAATGMMTTLAGTGVAGSNSSGTLATQTQLNGPSQIVVGPDGAMVFLDALNSAIRKFVPVYSDFFPPPSEWTGRAQAGGGAAA